MATTRAKFAFTDYQMFAVLVTVAGEVSPDTIRAAMGDAYDPDRHTPEALARKVSHKYHVLKENAAKPKAPSKTAQLNARLAEQVAKEFATGEPFTLNDVMAKHTCEVPTFAKASVIVNVLLADRRVRKTAPINGKMAYTVIG